MPRCRAERTDLCRRYTDEEIQARDIDSPFRVDGPVVGLFNALLMLREKEDKNVSKMISSVEMLAEANSERGALSSQLLPALHWVLLTALSGLILVAFLLYDSDFSGTVEENRIIFAVLAAAFLSVLRVWPRCLCCYDLAAFVTVSSRLTCVRACESYACGLRSCSSCFLARMRCNAARHGNERQVNAHGSIAGPPSRITAVAQRTRACARPL